MGQAPGSGDDGVLWGSSKALAGGGGSSLWLSL